MKIERIEIHLIRVPFDMGAAPKAFAGMNWTSVDSLFVRVCTDVGVEGWGEGWGHVACPTTSAALASLVGPAFIGSEVSDRSALMAEMAHRFHIHGRSGPVVYALSAIEIALWDIAGKVASLPIASLLGGAPRELTAYASLLRYAEPELVARAVERALAQGFRHIKLHEVRLETVRAARAACGESVWMALDTNCPWSVSQSIDNARALEASRLAWLEEPVWPPEDFHGLARVRAAASTPIAAGENVAGIHEMESMLRTGAVDICQPSVIKFGGIEAVAQAVTLARAHGVDYVPHCFYFGPGFLASLHLAAAYAPEVPFELFFGDLQASPYHDAVRARDGQLAVPTGPGLGIEPDLAVIDRCRLGAPIVIGR
ncbi:L-alanine-DL-glutamate epimerase [Variovorax sp. CF079]|uniref:mandelate racemase/muconate lactonizing enzyme family protein n=1 Tax=Variovorax sp. CF079 TaxID=1882774 RepID=UPI0008838D1C|nr:mandelate racemase/muconate lactonizing enzyme family protein [Variovorax sp. CF079]SDE58271.1 L-alanine-DL-glutamate epimerase [Variovorax sp. CF079]